MESVRREAPFAYVAVQETINLDLTNKSNIQKQISIPLLGYNLVSVVVTESGCTGISGNFEIKQSPGDADVLFDLPEGALTIASAATGSGAVTKGTLTMEYLVINLPTTLPAVGKIRITVTAKS